jgi:hypothetical protein
MIAHIDPRLSVGIIQSEITEALTAGAQIMPFGDGSELRLMPSNLTAESSIPTTDVLNDPELRAKIKAIGSVGVYAELDQADNVTLYADLERLRNPSNPDRTITLPKEAIFTPRNRTGLRFTHIDIHVASEQASSDFA